MDSSQKRSNNFLFKLGEQSPVLLLTLWLKPKTRRLLLDMTVAIKLFKDFWYSYWWLWPHTPWNLLNLDKFTWKVFSKKKDIIFLFSWGRHSEADFIWNAFWILKVALGIFSSHISKCYPCIMENFKCRNVNTGAQIDHPVQKRTINFS